jgi:hypothetical protein
VSGQFSGQSGDTGLSEIQITIPVVTGMSNREDLAGTASDGEVSGKIECENSDRAKIQWVATQASGITRFSYTYTYQII